MKIWIPLLTLVTLSGAMARDKFDWSKLKGTIDFNTNGTSVSSETVDVTKMGQSFAIGIKTKFSEDLKASFSGGFSFEVGSNNSQFQDAFRPRQTIYMSEGKLEWTPKLSSLLSMFSGTDEVLTTSTATHHEAPASGIDSLLNVHVDAGAVNMGFLKLPILVSWVAFLGAKEVVEVKPLSLVSLRFTGVQAIANNHMLSQRLGNVNENGTPHFFLEKLDLSIGKSQGLLADVFVGHYLYENLSSAVAYASRPFGNSVTMGNEANTAYYYAFQGYLAGGSLSYDTMMKYKFGLDYKYIKNPDAPDARNTGYVSKAWGTRYGSKADTTVSIERFENQSDTSPAFYNSMMYGNNNAQGMKVGADFQFHKNDFSLHMGYTQIRVLMNTRTNLYQTDTDIYTIGLNKGYDL